MLQTLAWLFLCYFKTCELARLFYIISQKFNISINELRKYERVLLKQEKQKCDLDFLEKCRQLDILPKFLTFRSPRFISSSSVKSLQRKALNSEIKKKLRAITTTGSQAESLKEFCRTNLSFFYYTVLNSILYKFIRSKKKDWSQRLNNKLQLAWIRQRFSAPDRTLQNKSSYSLTIQKENSLPLGLKNCIAPPYIDKFGTGI